MTDVIVLMAGHSRRFAEAGFVGPKALLPVRGAPMIQRLLQLFRPEDRVHIVVSDAQIARDPQFADGLRSFAPDVRVHVVAAHDEGPVRSLLAVEGIAADAPVLVSYCDLLVDWGDADPYAALREEGVVVTASGFQPASFGDTVFCHLRLDADGRMLELREKGCFTEDRRQEPLSVGIYGFPRWGQAVELARARLAAFVPSTLLPECYVSLLMLDLLAQGVTVRAVPVRRFLCLGTPEDYAQYRGWEAELSAADPAPPAGDGATLLPLAGRGQRFVDAGTTTPKPLLPVRGAPMAVRAARSLPSTPRLVIVTRADGPSVPEALLEALPGARFVTIDGETTGPAATCLRAMSEINPHAPLLIASGDYEVRFDAAAWARVTEDPSVDAAIWTVTPGPDLFAPWTSYAWVEADTDGRVSRLVEKQPISQDPRRDPLAIGTFWFRRAEDFARAAQESAAAGVTVGGEHYVGTAMNTMVARGQRVVSFPVLRWTCSGTPFEWELLRFWEGHFSEAVAGSWWQK